jgi:hypothetical protein
MGPDETRFWFPTRQSLPRHRRYLALVLVRIGIAVALFVVLAGVALVMERRGRRDAPSQGRSVVPAQLDRRDFLRPDAPWLVVLFTSAACESCEGLYEKAAPLASDEVAVAEVEFPEGRALHERYQIDAAPLTLVADAQGVVHASILGAFNATELWTAVATLRAPGPDVVG